ncbi:response regulator transcription factor [Mobilitalea sibirica]|uniref:Stage 0 sporulation protein A homolog n=1 Tax=Mobilitalea sibirica TaxID=1462919 RepID=A0A8J7H198_9FIRM|nr:response regulator transcription factor [Mobilitalea sibirica]MBH1939840.1 response regulator transcription factor [Mobilitalea sibirica]
MVYQILVVEDQKEISDVLKKYIAKEGYGVAVANHGFEALELFGDREFHLILLDIMMPGINGYEVLKEIRKTSDVPVIMLTAKQDEVDRLKGFEIGADDYVIKPFSPRELMKRIQVFLKRVYQEADEIIYSFKNLKLYTKSMKLIKNDNQIALTAAEYKLLFVLFKNKGQVLTREQLIELAYGNDYEGYDRNIDSFIKRIRQKIEDDPKNPKILITKYGAGYIFGGDEG